MDGALEFPVISNEEVLGRIREWLRHRIAGLPCLHFAIVDGVAEEENIGRRIAGVVVSTGFLQIDL